MSLQRLSRGLGWIVFLTWCSVSIVWGAGIEVGHSASASRPRPIRPPITPPPVERDDAVFRLLNRVSVAPPCQDRELVLYPLVLWGGSAESDVLTMDEAFQRGEFRIEETGVVNDLRIRNDGARPVFVMGGAILRGGRQNRFPRQDLLVPPQSGWLTIPVYCGEEHRWSNGRMGDTFAPERATSSFGLRRQGLADRPQGDVWREAERATRELKAASPTGDFAQVYRTPGVRDELQRYRDALVPRIPERTVGLIVYHSGRLVGMDIFESSNLFERLRGQVIESYVLDALRPLPSADEPSQYRGSIAWQSPKRFLESLRAARLTEVGTPGSGRAFALQAEAGEGRGLEYRGEILHLAAYAHSGFVHPAPFAR